MEKKTDTVQEITKVATAIGAVGGAIITVIKVFGALGGKKA
ncbi:MAG: hypothetical protein SOX94_06305 [Prevotella sp.]|nr:hypothetical protein [Prevotella sp.]